MFDLLEEDLVPSPAFSKVLPRFDFGGSLLFHDLSIRVMELSLLGRVLPWCASRKLGLVCLYIHITMPSKSNFDEATIYLSDHVTLQSRLQYID